MKKEDINQEVFFVSKKSKLKKQKKFSQPSKKQQQ